MENVIEWMELGDLDLSKAEMVDDFSVQIPTMDGTGIVCVNWSRRAEELTGEKPVLVFVDADWEKQIGSGLRDLDTAHRVRMKPEDGEKLIAYLEVLV